MDDNKEYGIRPMPNFYDGTASVLDVKGCMAFTVTNIGAVKAFLFETMEIMPGQQIPFENIMGLPFFENVPVSFESSSALKKLRVIKFNKVLMPNICKE